MYITTLQQYQTKAQDATPFMVISLHNELLQVCMYIRGKDVIRTGKNNQVKHKMPPRCLICDVITSQIKIKCRFYFRTEAFQVPFFVTSFNLFWQVTIEKINQKN